VAASIDSWIPHLIRLWRGQGSKLPADRLTQAELRLLAPALRELSAGLTGNRNLAGRRYMNDPRLLGAYLLYFWPVSYAQLHYVLADTRIAVGAALDIGCGPLPATCALLDHGASSVTAADVNRAATSIGRLLLKDRTNVRLATWNALTPAPLPSGRFDTVVLSHILNELWSDRDDRLALRAELLSRIASRMSSSSRVVIIEPALLGIARDLLGLRDRLASDGWRIESPCFIQDACPALPLRNGTCHAAFRWNAPKIVASLASLAKIDKSRPAMSYLVAAPPNSQTSGSEEDEHACRVVSDSMRNKAGRERLFVCGPDGRFAVSVGPNDRYSAAASFRSAARGDVVTFSGLERRGEGYAICEASHFSVLRAASRVMRR